MDWKLTSEIFYNFAIGLGAIGGGVFVGAKGMVEFWKSRNIQVSISKIKKRYPRSELNKSFRLVDTEEAPGRVYLLDTKTRKRHWIQSGATLLDLDFYWSDFKRIATDEFNKFDEETPILTRGEPGK